MGISKNGKPQKSQAPAVVTGNVADSIRIPTSPYVDLDPDTVRKYLAPGATPQELFLFMGICKTCGLNPLTGEVWFVKYDKDGPGQAVVGYIAYLKRAEATGKLKHWEVNILSDVTGEYAEITIDREDFIKPFIWRVDRSEFDTSRSSWKKMPGFMLKKVAIAQGMRLAFPNEISDLPYTDDEVKSFAPEAEFFRGVPTPEDTTGPMVDFAALRKTYYEKIKGMFDDNQQREDFNESLTGKRHVAQFTQDEYAKVYRAIDELQALARGEGEPPPEGELPSGKSGEEVEFTPDEDLPEGAGTSGSTEDPKPKPKAKEKEKPKAKTGGKEKS